MYELDYHKLKDGSVVAIFEYRNADDEPVKWAVSKFSRADIEQWMVEFGTKEEAKKHFEEMKHERSV